MIEVSVTSAANIESSSNKLVFDVNLTEAPVNNFTLFYRFLKNGTADTADFFFSSNINNSRPNSIEFLAGETTKQIELFLRTDADDELDESITLELFGAPAGVQFEGGANVLRTLGITRDDDGALSNLSLHVLDPVLVESDSGQKNMVFEIRLSQPASGDVTFAYETVDGTALAGEDYEAKSGNVTISNGDEVAFVSVPVKGDTKAEANESFSLVVTPPVSPTIGTQGAVGTATIVDDDTGAGPAFSVRGGYAVESSSYAMRFVIELSEPPTSSASIDYRLETLGDATDDDLFFSLSTYTRTVEFAAGETSKDIIVFGRTDTTAENDEAFSFEIFNPSAGTKIAGGPSTQSALGFILDDDGVGNDTILAGVETEVREGRTASKVIVAQVQLSRPATETLEFDVRTLNSGNAILGTDFQLLDKEVTFAPGQDVAGVRIRILNDVLQSESSETIRLGFDLTTGSAFSGTALPQTITILNTSPYTNKADVMRLTQKNDVANTKGGNDEIYGLGGNDKIYTQNGADFASGGAGNDLLVGGAGADRLIGGTGSDRLVGGGGNDIMDGGGGNDTLIGGAGGDRHIGGKGTDTASYASAGKKVAVNLSGPAAKNTGDAKGDTFNSVENLTGSRFADVLGGTKGANVLSGGKGNDIARGGAGNDRVLGDGGNDRLFGDGGRDFINGGAGNDILNGGAGPDRFVFNAGKDRVVDFRDDLDTLLLDDSLWAGRLSAREVVRDFATVQNGDVVFNFSGGNTLRILNENDKSDLINDIQII